MNRIKLGVNIDHVATIRNARGVFYPDPVKASLVAQNSGADSVTIHLREDRRHIKDDDLKKIKKKIKIPLNLEMAPTKEMLNIALKNRPDFVCIVPEKRKEITTEGGLNLSNNKNLLRKIIGKLKKKGIRISLFIEPKISDILLSKRLDVDCVELHTGEICNLINERKKFNKAYLRLKKAASYAQKIGLEVHAGHGITDISVKKIAKIKFISELNIGHFIVADSLFIGLKRAIKKFKKILRK